MRAWSPQTISAVTCRHQAKGQLDCSKKRRVVAWRGWLAGVTYRAFKRPGQAEQGRHEFGMLDLRPLADDELADEMFDRAGDLAVLGHGCLTRRAEGWGSHELGGEAVESEQGRIQVIGPHLQSIVGDEENEQNEMVAELAQLVGDERDEPAVGRYAGGGEWVEQLSRARVDLLLDRVTGLLELQAYIIAV